MNGMQLPLAVHLPQTAAFDSFVTGADNHEVVQALQSGQSAYLFGAAGTGKTHLLMAAARAHGGTYLPWSAVAAAGLDVLEGYSHPQHLAIDEVDLAGAADDSWQAMLRLLDQRHQHQRVTWCAALKPPEHLPGLAADLRTRLAQFPRYGLHTLDEAGQRTLLLEGARRRGLKLPDEVVRWWLHHLPRDPARVLDTLDQLDRAALREQRRVTLPFVQAVLAARAAETGQTARSR